MSKEGGFDLNQGIPGKYSITKIFHYPKKMISLLEGIVSPPISISLNPTNRCDHNCWYCVYNPEFSGIHENMKRTDELSKDKIMEVLKDLKDMNVQAITYSGGGEPLVHPNITDIFKKTLEYGLGLSIITNGQRLSGERAELLANADWVRVSIDYPNAETMNKTRRKDEQAFNQVASNLSNFAKIKKSSCDFEANCVINEHNFDKLYDIAHFAKEHGLENIRFAPCWFPNFEAYHDKLRKTVSEQIEKAKQLADKTFSVGSTYEKYFITNAGEGYKKRPNKCPWAQAVSVICADYNVYACHNKSYDANGLVGSIKNQSFKEMWFSKETDNFFKTFNPQKNCQHECSSHERNVLISEWLACSDQKYNKYP